MLKRLFGASEPTEDEQADLQRGLGRTRGGLLGALGGLLGVADITEETWETLEAALIQSDFGGRASVEMVEELREQARHAGIRRADELPRLLRHILVRRLASAGDRDAEPVEQDADARSRPELLLVVGVNGSGKTTTIAKLAHRLQAGGRSVLLVAADTFRAAAIDQLATWAERVGAEIVRGTPGGDPGAVVYDALRSAAGRQADVIIVDTAGRLHTQHNLMQELAKVRRVIEREMPGKPDETLLVLDATTGQNGLEQARHFTDTAGVTALALAKLDSSAKGGVAFAASRELGLPIRWVGTGESLEDLAPFDASAYVDGLLGTGASKAR